jgi:hypothetical protein
VSRDFEELLESFNAAGVRYLIGGAHALALHARPRATKDLDVFVDPTRTNARRVIAGLSSFFDGSAPSYVTEEALLDPDLIVQLGVAPVRVDILSTFGTLNFRQAWSRRVEAQFGSVPASYLSRDHLIAEKRHFDRPQDRADLAALLSTPAGRSSKTRRASKKARPVRRR